MLPHIWFWYPLVILSVFLPIPLVLGVIRPNLVVNGVTLPPKTTRVSGKLAPPCPESHPYPYNGFTYCCSSKSRNASQCDGKTGMLLGDDLTGCCSDTEKMPCQQPPPCKMHDKGYERPTTHVLLVGSAGTHDWNIDPKGKVYGDRALSGGGDTYKAVMRVAEEYPPRSGQVVVCGGANLEIDNNEFSILWHSLRVCERYNFKSNVWNSFPMNVETRREAGCAVVNGVYWVFGGRDEHGTTDNNRETKFLDTTEYYDESTGKWSLGPPLPVPITVPAVVSKSDTEVFLVGMEIMPDAVSNYDKAEVSNKVILFDLSTGHHEYMSNMPTKRAYVAAARTQLSGGRAGMVVAGGYDDNKFNVDKVELYDIENDQWSEGPIMPMGARNFQNGYAGIDDKLWLFGGNIARHIDYYAVDHDPDVWVFHGESANPPWTKVGEIPTNQELDEMNRPSAAVLTVIEPY